MTQDEVMAIAFPKRLGNKQWELDLADEREERSGWTAEDEAREREILGYPFGPRYHKIYRNEG